MDELWVAFAHDRKRPANCNKGIAEQPRKRAHADAPQNIGTNNQQTPRKFTDEQINTLLEHFEKDPRPTAETLSAIEASIGPSPSVPGWFARQRTKAGTAAQPPDNGASSNRIRRAASDPATTTPVAHATPPLSSCGATHASQCFSSLTQLVQLLSSCQGFVWRVFCAPHDKTGGESHGSRPAQSKLIADICGKVGDDNDGLPVFVAFLVFPQPSPQGVGITAQSSQPQLRIISLFDLGGKPTLPSILACDTLQVERIRVIQQCLTKQPLEPASSTKARPLALCFDAKRSMRLLMKHNVVPPKADWVNMLDPVLAHWLLQPDDHDLPSERALLQSLNSNSPLLKRQTPTFWDVVCQRLAFCWASMDLIFPRLREALMEDILRLEMRLCAVLADMEVAGIGLDDSALVSHKRNALGCLQTLEQRAHEIAGENFLLSSPQQVSHVLFDVLKLPVPKQAQRAQMVKSHTSTSEAILRQLRPHSPLPDVILQHRHISKLLSAWMDIGDLAVHNEATNMLRLHTTWLQDGTGTGRLSSQRPNLQNIPKQMISVSVSSSSSDSQNTAAESVIASTDEIDSDSTACMVRDAFVPRSGHVLVAGDYNQLELRVLACLTRDPWLMQQLSVPPKPNPAPENGSNESKQPQHDVFRHMASQWLSRPLSSITQAERDQVKKLTYGIIYGIGVENLAEQLKCSVQQSAKLKNSFLSSFGSIKRFIAETQATAQEQKYVTTLLGRRRPLPGIDSADSGQQARAKRQAVNSVVQGTAADLVKTAMIKCEMLLKRDVAKPFSATLLLQIHDELVWEVREDKVQEFVAYVRTPMEKSFSMFPVAFPMKFSFGKTLGQLQAIE